MTTKHKPDEIMDENAERAKKLIEDLRAERLLREYHELKLQHAQLEKRLGAIRNTVLKNFKSGTYGNFQLTIDQKERECFSWPAAKEALPEKALEKLMLFVSWTPYQTVRVTSLVDEENK